MSLFESGPPEIITQILLNCNTFSQVLALTSTCRHIHMIWIGNSSTIIYHIAKTSIRCFEDALIAVRATDIVISACQRGEQPPHPFPLDQLGIDFRKPNLVELKAVYDFQHLARCLDHLFIIYGDYPTLPRPGDVDEWEVWRKTFYRAIYRTMFTGAVLYRAFNEPFYLAEKEGRTEFLQKFQDSLDSIEDSDVEYLRQFPVYNFDAEAETEAGKWTWRGYENIFGPIADWLVNDGRIRGVEDGLREVLSQSHDSATLGVFREIIILIAAYECFPGNFIGQHGRSEEKWKLAHSKHANQDARKVSVIMFGHFRIEEISMPAVSSDARLWLPAKLLPLMTSGTASSIDITRIIRVLQRDSTRPDLHDGYPATPPMLHLFDYILRKEFDLKFNHDLFENWPASNYTYEVKSGSVFCCPQMRYFEPYHPPVLSRSR